MAVTLTYETLIRYNRSSKVVSHSFIVVDDHDAELFYKDNARRVLVAINGAPNFPAGIVPNDGMYIIMLNKQFISKHKLAENQIVHVILMEDTSKYGMPMPEEFNTIFEIDEEAYAIFESLTPGAKRTLMHAVTKIKSPQLRADRTYIMIEHLKNNNGKIDYKKLNQEIKESR